MKIKCFMLYFVFSTYAVNAQVATNFNVYFRNNVAEISSSGQKSIDSALRFLLAPKEFYQIELLGFADSVGSTATNLKLSKERAKNVADYFERKAFLPKNILLIGKGNAPHKGIDSQRKVNIRIYLKIPEIQLFKDSLPQTEYFVFDTKYGLESATRNGGFLSVPSEGFVDENGKLVEGKVTLEYNEYRNIPQFLARSLPANDRLQMQHFRSVGQFEIQAFQQGKPLKMAPHKNIDVVFGTNSRVINLNMWRVEPEEGKSYFERYITNYLGDYYTRIPGIESCGFLGKTDFCFSMGNCEKFVFLVKTGLKYASSKLSVRETIALHDSLENSLLASSNEKLLNLYRAVSEAQSEISNANDYLKELKSPKYGIERSKITNRSAIIHLTSQDRYFNEAIVLDGVDFKLKENLNDSLYTLEWDYLELKLNRWGKGSLKLKSDHTLLFSKSVKMVQAVTNTVDVPLLESYLAFKNVRRERTREIKKVENSLPELEKILKEKKQEYSAYSPIHKKIVALLDSLKKKEIECLWSLTKNENITEQERQMSFETWINFFDENKGMMFDRYLALKNSREKYYSTCDSLARVKDAYYKLVFAQKPPSEKKPKEINSDTLIISVSVQLGIHNIAQTSNFQMTEMGFPNYPLRVAGYFEGQTEIKIVSILLFPKRNNGYFQYSGNHILHPYFLAFEHRFDKFIVLDEKGNLYKGVFGDLTYKAQPRVLVERIYHVEEFLKHIQYP